MPKKKEEETPRSVILSDKTLELIEQIIPEADDEKIQLFVNLLVQKYSTLSSTIEQINDTLVSLKDVIPDVSSKLSFVNTSCSKFVDTMIKAQVSNVDTTIKTGTTIGNNIEKIQKSGLVSQPKPGQVSVGMSGNKPIPKNAVKQHVKPINVKNAKTPDAPIKNDLIDGAPQNPAAAKILEEMRKKQNKGTNIAHPSGIFGKDMAKDVLIQP